jgi:hypothetical protein
MMTTNQRERERERERDSNRTLDLCLFIDNNDKSNNLFADSIILFEITKT